MVTVTVSVCQPQFAAKSANDIKSVNVSILKISKLFINSYGFGFPYVDRMVAKCTKSSTDKFKRQNYVFTQI